jgi:hypothetical protein
LAAIFAFAALLIALSIAVFVIRRRRAAGDEGDGGATREKEVVEAW